MTEDAYLTLTEVALICRVSERTVARWIACAGLPAVRVGRRRMVRRAQLDVWLDAGGAQAA
jgi:excisionase family DNA binding protein